MQLQLFHASHSVNTGITTAVLHAEKEDAGWLNKAKQAADNFIEAHGKGFRFMVEDLRQWVYVNEGLQPPPSERAWGFIPKYLTDKIKPVGYQAVKNLKANCTPARVWEIK